MEADKELDKKVKKLFKEDEILDSYFLLKLASVKEKFAKKIGIESYSQFKQNEVETQALKIIAKYLESYE